MDHAHMKQGKKTANSKKTFGERLRAARESAGLSRADLANKLGLTNPSQISRYEAGKGYPTFQALVAISETLPVDLNWLLTGEPSPLASAIHHAMQPCVFSYLNDLVQKRQELRQALQELMEPYPKLAAQEAKYNALQGEEAAVNDKIMKTMLRLQKAVEPFGYHFTLSLDLAEWPPPAKK